MGRKAFTPEQIIFKLREVEVLVGQGESIALAYRKIAITEQTLSMVQGIRRHGYRAAQALEKTRKGKL